MLPALWFGLEHLGAVLLFGWLAAAVGARLLRGMPFASSAEALGVGAALGLATLGTALLVLGLTGLLAIGPVIALLAVAALASWRESVAGWRKLCSAVRGTLVGGGARSVALLAAAVFGLVLAPMLVLALYPPTGYDALNYHLPYVRAFLEEGALVTVESLRFPVFPQLNELLFTAMALLVDDVAAQAVQLLPALLIAVLVGSWAARAGGRSCGPWAAALWLGNPLVVWMAGQAYVDLGLTMLVVAGFVCLERYRLDRERSFLLLGGVLLGAACGVKYLGVFALALGVAHAWGSSLRGSRTQGALVVLGAAAVIAAPWYARIWWETGSPVFPYLGEVFGGDDWLRGGASAAGGAGGEVGGAAAQGWGPLWTRGWEMLREAPGWVLSLPLTVTWARDTFNRQAPLTPWTVILVVATVWAARRDRRLRWLLAGCVVYAVLLLYTSRRDLRFLLPVAAAVAAGGAVALRPLIAAALHALRCLGRRFATARALVRRDLVTAAVLVACLGPGVFYGGYKILERGPPPLDPAAVEVFLARWVRGYTAISFLNRSHQGEYTVYGVPFEPVRYYARGSYLGDRYGAYSYRLLRDRQWRPEAVHALLRGWGVDYLLAGVGYHTTFERAERCFVPVFGDESSRVYRLTADGNDGNDGNGEGCAAGAGGPGAEPRRALERSGGAK